MPYDEEYEGYTGNAGATIEFYYSFAALALAKRDRIMAMLSRRKPASAVAWLNCLLRQNEGCSSEQICADVEKLIDAWEHVGRYEGFSGVSDMLCALKSIGNRSLSRDFITKAVMPRYSGRKNKQIVSLLRTLKTAGIEQALAAFVREKLNAYPTSVLDLLRADPVVSRREDASQSMLSSCASEILDRPPEMLQSLSKNPRCMHFIDGSIQEIKIRPKTLVNLITIFRRAGRLDLAAAAVLRESAAAAGLDRTVPKAPAKLSKDEQIHVSEAYRILWLASVEFLLQRSESSSPPADWRLDKKSDCGCMYCTELNRFCDAPRMQRFRCPINREYRQHLRRKINARKLEIDCRTESAGRPYTLILAKNRAGCQQKLKTYGSDVRSFRALLKFVPAAALDDQHSLRVRSAIARSESFG